MEQAQTFSKISIVLDKVFFKDALAILKELGLHVITIETGRSVLLKQSSGLKKILSTSNQTVEDSVNIISFLVYPEQEHKIIIYLTNALKLDTPGKGSIYSKEVTVHRSSLPSPIKNIKIPDCDSKIIAQGLMGISCITQKGEGNTVAEIGLNTGTAVPTITFGIGTGLRNRLGLWRIFIPAEKEISSLIVNESDAETVMDMMINAGQLDQPGKGFIYTYPIKYGVLNTKFYEGTTSQAASIEQIVSAIDEIKGTTEWRKKSLSTGAGAAKSRKFLSGLVNFSLICNQGMGETLTKVAMAAGAAGATISLLRHSDLVDETNLAISPAREISVMTIGEKQIETITTALEEAGLLSPEVSGEIHLSPVPKACTFLGK